MGWFSNDEILKNVANASKTTDGVLVVADVFILLFVAYIGIALIKLFLRQCEQDLGNNIVKAVQRRPVVHI